MIGVLAGLLSLVAGATGAYVTAKAQFSNWRAQNNLIVQQEKERDDRAAMLQKELVSLQNKLTADREKELESIRAQRDKEFEDSKNAQDQLEHQRQFARDGQALIDEINRLISDFQQAALEFQLWRDRTSDQSHSPEQFKEEVSKGDLIVKAFTKQDFRCQAECRRLRNLVQLYFGDNVTDAFNTLNDAIVDLAHKTVDEPRGPKYGDVVYGAQRRVSTALQTFQGLAYQSVTKALLPAAK